MPRKKRKRRLTRPWTKWPKERLLDVRLCDLNLKIEGTILERRIKRLYRDLDSRYLDFRPYFWLSDDWFTPDGLTGTAIPFYLAHPRLVRLERHMIGEAEGATEDWCLRFLRHECGHAITHAYRLNRRRRWQKLFGLSSHSYPRFYRPNPYSKRHVQHLEYWYAQSHPDEDFAETFAVWLQPRFQWRKQYQGWPTALRKLEYVNSLMYEISDEKPAVRTREKLDTLRTLKKTLREHYARKAPRYGLEYSDTYDADLYQLFTRDRRGTKRRRRERASAFIRRNTPEIKRLVAPWLGGRRYQVNHILKDVIGRCRTLKLYVKGSERRVKIDFAIVLCKHVMDSLYRQRYWVEM
jgi:hypothetical protein